MHTAVKKLRLKQDYRLSALSQISLADVQFVQNCTVAALP